MSHWIPCFNNYIFHYYHLQSFFFFFYCSFLFPKSSLILLRVFFILILKPILYGLLSQHPLLYSFPLSFFFASVDVLSSFLYDSHYPGSIDSLGWQRASGQKGESSGPCLCLFCWVLGTSSVRTTYLWAPPFSIYSLVLKKAILPLKENFLQFSK